MTDHLSDARALIHSAARATDAGTALSWLTMTCGHIIAHLEAQQTEPEPEPDYGPRPDGCCGTCPPILGGGYDCTCADNPRCNANKADRLDVDGYRWVWCDECDGFRLDGHEVRELDCGWTVADIDEYYGPLTFAHPPAEPPTTAPQDESGQGGQDEAVQAAMAVLRDEGADSEGGWHSWRCFDRDRYPEPCDCTEQATRAAIAAAEPHIRAKIAAEVEAMDLHDQYGPLTIHGARANAARIARGEQP